MEALPLRRKDQKEATRLALREAFLACSAERGFAATSIADVTRRAGVAKGTFYVHFATKEALLDALLGDFNRALAQRVAALAGASLGGPLDATIEAIARAFVAHLRAHEVFVRAYAERSAAGLDVAALPFGINPEVRAVLIAALAERFPRTSPLDLELATQGLLVLWLRLGLQLLYREDIDEARVVRLLTRLSAGAIAELDAPLAPAPPRRTPP